MQIIISKGGQGSGSSVGILIARVNSFVWPLGEMGS